MRLIPKNKICGLRFGQLIVNTFDKKFFDTALFYIENDALERKLKNYLKEYKKRLDECR